MKPWSPHCAPLSRHQTSGTTTYTVKHDKKKQEGTGEQGSRGRLLKNCRLSLLMQLTSNFSPAVLREPGVHAVLRPCTATWWSGQQQTRVQHRHSASQYTTQHSSSPAHRSTAHSTQPLITNQIHTEQSLSLTHIHMHAPCHSPRAAPRGSVWCTAVGDVGHSSTRSAGPCRRC